MDGRGTTRLLALLALLGSAGFAGDFVVYYSSRWVKEHDG